MHELDQDAHTLLLAYFVHFYLSYRAGKVLNNRNDPFTMSSLRPYKCLHVNTISMFTARKDVGSVIEAHGYL